jgi:hypothetical protein
LCRWFFIVYDDDDEFDQSEEVFVGISADANEQHETIAFRNDGSAFNDEIRFDPVAIQSAAQPAQPAQPAHQNAQSDRRFGVQAGAPQTVEVTAVPVSMDQSMATAEIQAAVEVDIRSSGATQARFDEYVQPTNRTSSGDFHFS